MEQLLARLDQLPATSEAAFTAVAAAGLLMVVASSSLPLVSVVVGYVAGQKEAADVPSRARGALFSLGFVLGLATVDALIGALYPSGRLAFLMRPIGPKLARVAPAQP